MTTDTPSQSVGSRVMTFTPSKEEFKDFNQYIAYMESQGAHRAGMARVSPRVGSTDFYPPVFYTAALSHACNVRRTIVFILVYTAVSFWTCNIHNWCGIISVLRTCFLLPVTIWVTCLKFHFTLFLTGNSSQRMEAQKNIRWHRWPCNSCSHSAGGHWPVRPVHSVQHSEETNDC